MEIRRGGKLYRYYRRKGAPLVPLPGDLPMDDPAFLRAYAEARDAAPTPTSKAKAGSLAALIEEAKRSDRWRQAGKLYRGLLQRHFDAIAERGADVPARGLRDRHVRTDLKSAGDPIGRLKAWRVLGSVGLEEGYLEVNPTLTVKAPRRPPSDGHEPWTAADVAAFRAHHPIGSTPRAAMEALYWTGARIGDVVLIGPGMVAKDGVLAFRQSKTGDMAYVPWTCPLPAYAEGMAADRQRAIEAIAAINKGHMTFLATGQGTRSSKSLGNMIRRAAREAGVEKSAHGLRKSRAVELADAHATPHQIMSWTGHKTLTEVERYTRRSDRRRAVMG